MLEGKRIEQYKGYTLTSFKISGYYIYMIEDANKCNRMQDEYPYFTDLPKYNTTVTNNLQGKKGRVIEIKSHTECLESAKYIIDRGLLNRHSFEPQTFSSDFLHESGFYVIYASCKFPRKNLAESN